MLRLKRACSNSNRDTLPYPTLLRVKWGSRIAGFDISSSRKTIIQKASAYYRLEHIAEDDFVLTTSWLGGELEVTDDVMKRLPDGAAVTLKRISSLRQVENDHATVVHEKSGSVQPRRGTSSSTSYTTVGRPARLPSLPTQPVQTEQQRPRSPPEPYDDKDGSSSSDLPSHYSNFRARKPVIYLFPPEALPNVVVSVNPVPQWSFSYVYPLSDIKRMDDGRQSITWSVSASADGFLVEKGTGVELSYLFWEGVTHPAAPPSPPFTPIDSGINAEHITEFFDPASPSLSPDTPTSVLLPLAQLLPYLDSALRNLTLHTAARNDFITYWLPAFSKQPFVALRFLSQPTYERAAELVVQPAPDVVTRVMMLFRGVPTAEVGTWAAALERAREVDWASVVGVKQDALDKHRFRVLEWGGMEVV